MSYPFFTFILVILCGYSLWIGKKTSHEAQNNTDYFLSGRSLKVFGLTLTLLATQLGGGAIIGNADAAYQHGWKALFYSLGLSLGLLILSLGVGSKFRKLDVNTLPQLFQKKYNSSFLQTIAALFSIISLFLILMAIGIAARKIFISIGLESTPLFLIFWSVSIVYTVIGGLSAVVKTDVIQMLFIIFALLLSFAVLLFNIPNSSLGFSLTPPTYLETIQQVSVKTPWNEWILMPLMFVIIGQDMSQRCFAANSSKTVSFATFWAAISLLLLSAIPTFIGTLAAYKQFVPTNSGSILMEFIELSTNPYITALFAAAILMAILSTADSLLCSISLNISQDILHKIVPSFATDIKISRAVTFIVGISAMSLSFLFQNIIPMMIFAYKVSIYALFVPIIMATIYENPKRSAAFASIISGLVLFILSETFWKTTWFDAFSLSLNASIYLIFTHLFSKQSFKAKI